MRKIDTEHGPVYVTTGDEDNGAYQQLKMQGTETEQLGEDLWLDTQKYRINGPLCAFIVTCALVLGFGIGSFFHDDSSTRVTLIISFTILLFFIGRARNMWLRYESAYMEMLDEHRAEEHKLLDKRLKVEAQVNKQLSAATKLKAAEDKTNAKSFAFTSEDFDMSAQALLSKPVKEARRKKAKVTGEGLVMTFLKSIR
jgi:hypothetical protein